MERRRVTEDRGSGQGEIFHIPKSGAKCLINGAKALLVTLHDVLDPPPLLGGLALDLRL